MKIAQEPSHAESRAAVRGKQRFLTPNQTSMMVARAIADGRPSASIDGDAGAGQRLASLSYPVEYTHDLPRSRWLGLVRQALAVPLVCGATESDRYLLYVAAS